MRPRGQIRQALQQAAHELAHEHGGATWRRLAERACVGYAAAKTTVRDMARAGELAPAGEERTPHARRPMVLWAPASSRHGTSPAALATVMQTWHR